MLTYSNDQQGRRKGGGGAMGASAPPHAQQINRGMRVKMTLRMQEMWT